ncbi:LRR repeats and ubiquitin-like domain-containing protein At2g30105 [Punica granatum]|uniref:LRR repeats and ubiquitin-like domain-containing protein At2g30105 n=2 Tax=Punica granatum TaxID=22663 RepID=A0A6P8D093_PUNGR|nr:LRR repeats and ubiquitin-like domain-containing protein At2g30105 [Punica granatum]XP_031385004.1 LRR repeats and ubiquitin-like domain-containing protein At2g30105 [Punica granatum]PKI51287.1 hypothetical protein CRG98_028316 [Punica granatum]
MDAGAEINLTVKFSGRSIPISTSPDTTVKELKSLLQPLTNVLPRGQKLIFKGKVLVDSQTLKASDLTNGAKLMLMASQGLHQGDGPILKEARTRPIRRDNDACNAAKQKMVTHVDKTRLERWKATGVVALADCNLKAIPDEVWACGTSTRTLDISNNSIQDVPSQIGSLTSMQKFMLNANGLCDESISWEGLASLKFLTVLSMSQNNLTALPLALGSLGSLRHLDIANNKLTSLPDEIGCLTRLELLKANNNRISTIPAHIDGCCTLMEVDLSHNLLLELPETVCNLRNLKALHLSNNGLNTLPHNLFKECTSLCTLGLHNTEITIDNIRQFEGWEGFEERRRLKHQKQLDFRVASSAEFDEGADKK